MYKIKKLLEMTVNKLLLTGNAFFRVITILRNRLIKVKYFY